MDHQLPYHNDTLQPNVFIARHRPHRSVTESPCANRFGRRVRGRDQQAQKITCILFFLSTILSTYNTCVVFFHQQDDLPSPALDLNPLPV